MQAAEAGDIEQFIRLYQGDNNRLMVVDARGRTAAHLAAAKNRANILQYMHAQQASEYCTVLHWRGNIKKIVTYISQRKFYEFLLNVTLQDVIFRNHGISDLTRHTFACDFC